MNNLEAIAQFVEFQFPEFYKEDGINFVQFIKAYYEWEDERSQTRKLVQYRDIDDTLDEFLIHFQNEYMHQIPKEILGDKRLLQKHILDLYRAKGSQEGIRLVFRLLFNEEIEIYLPSEDIFKLDASVFYEAKYLEVSKMDTNHLFQGQVVYGITSGASAIVEAFEQRYVNGVLIDIFFLSNIQGEFAFREYVSFEGLNIQDRPYILGSPVSIDILNSDANFADGEELHVSSTEDGLYLLATVDDLKNNSTGIINFTLVDGGFGYSMSDTVIQITPGANTTGAGALFELGSIGGDIYETLLTRMLVGNYKNVVWNANSFANNANDFSNMRTSDRYAIIQDALEYDMVQFGTITSINVLSPGAGYDGDVTVKVFDPLYLSLQRGDYPNGNNAFIDNEAINGKGFVDTVKVKNSGFGYHKQNEPVTLNSTGDLRAVTGLIKLGGMGTAEGVWRDTVSFVDNDKYLQDDDYYQEYSYEVKVKRKLDDYADILRRTVHPAGNKLFGRARLVSSDIGVINDYVTISQHT